MQLNKILEIEKLYKNAPLDPNTIQEGILRDSLKYKLWLKNTGGELALQGVCRGVGVIVQAKIKDNGDLQVSDIERLINLFKENLAKAKQEAEEHEARINEIIERKPKAKVKLKEKKKPKPKDEPQKAKPIKQEAVRHNQDKTRFDLIPPCFIREVAEVFTFGAKKYAPENWKGFTPEQQEEIKASLLRHIYAYLEGEELDPESGLSHLAHAGCNLAFLSYFKNNARKS